LAQLKDNFKKELLTMKITKTCLFKSGNNGYLLYRIPALITLPGNRIIAFCEGRIHGPPQKPTWNDSGKIHTVIRISDDGGKTFGKLKVVAQDGENTVQNPCPVYDRDTGIIWLFLCWNDGNTDALEIYNTNGKRHVLLTRSDDRGETWSEPIDMTAELSRDNWPGYGTGPCHGLQMTNGRLVIPCWHVVYPLVNNDRFQSSGVHTLYSDDHGKTWHINADVNAHPTVGEPSIAEAKEGFLYVNMRRSPSGEKSRSIAYSSDGGATWGPVKADATLPDPMCQGSVINGLEAGKHGFFPLYFTNAADPGKRRNLTLRISYDGGQTWPESQVVEEGFSGYSDLAILENGSLACLYEAGGKEQKPYSELVFATLDMK
jgi:sialidase-1